MLKIQLSKSNIREINRKLEEFNYSIDIKSRVAVEELESNGKTILFVDGEPFFFSLGSRWVPTLKLLAKKLILKNVAIDMGAVKFVVSGADIMRPGIVELDENISAGDIVVITDINYKKPLAVGIALFSSGEIRKMERGKVITNLHYVGDKLWKSL